MIVNPGKNEMIEVQGRQYRRLCIKTHVITDADKIIDVVTKYAAPEMQQGDTLFITEKAVACTQKRAIPMKDIHPRPLQIEQALAVLEPGPVASTWNRSRHLTSCPSFTVDLLRGDAAGCCDGESFCVFLFTAGSGELCCGGQTEPVTAGECWLLPADSGEWQLRGNTTALLCYLL